MRIYITHCSAKKNASLRNTMAMVSPEELYTSTRTRRFMQICKEKGVRWAIFSDLYGVWFPEVKHQWYEKEPSKITRQEQEYLRLLEDFDAKLRSYSEIFFYYHPGRFHRLYRRLLEETSLRNRLSMITHLFDIE